ncbi:MULTISPECIES: hypothetical protein [unclassified Streptomyces]|uniref:hypothetical protein n=1 Tax=unclassified Streptomyces TaxID=2593676 RepID=UPI001907C039|nr:MULTISPECIES: hypothetical protein [unclassified Streptomyces]MCU4745577.1 hypothetical protein [Streptomyces sp. G-5]QQN79425.1 hypothetical protein IPZ77_19870 [Streptomyces sp. XC 2026]
MKLLNQLADAALRRVLPSATTEAAAQYDCQVGAACPGYPGANIWNNRKRECPTCPWIPSGCCYKTP